MGGVNRFLRLGGLRVRCFLYMSTTAPASEQAVIKTAYGEMTIAFWPDVAPKTVENFKKLAREGFYDGTAFHRIIKGFMIQGGCPNTKEGASGMPGTGGPGWKIKCETKGNPEIHTPGTLSMAHAGKDTGGSQFFVTHKATPHLDGVHTVFGRVVDDSDLKVVLAVKQGDRFSVEIVDE